MTFLSLKRNLGESVAQSGADAPLIKRPCLFNPQASTLESHKLCAYKVNSPTNRTYTQNYDIESSSDSCSSSDDDDDDDDDKNQVNNYSDAANSTPDVKAATSFPASLRRKSLRFANIIKSAPPVDSQLSKAVSQYSDCEDDEDDVVYQHANGNSTPSRQKRSKSSNDILKVNHSSDRGVLNKRYSVNISDVVRSLPSENQLSNDVESSQSFMPNHLPHQFNINNNVNNTARYYNGNIPRADYIARSRCFEYLVSAIDDAWTRYCDSTSYDEDLAYGFEKQQEQMNKPQHTRIYNGSPNSNVYTSEDDDGYKTEFSAITTVTEYDSDTSKKQMKFSMINNSLSNSSTPKTRRVSEVPENVRLQQLKDRFTKSKYYLEDLVDSDEFNDCLAFWTKWDLIKYSIVDFVEEDEEDEDIERRIEELEYGRFAGSLVN